MSATTILKIIEANDPKLVQQAREMVSIRPVDSNVVRRIYAHSILIHKSGDNFRDCIVFVCAVLKLYSPESLVADCKVRNGVCSIMAEKMEVSQQVISYYVKHAKHYYPSLIAIRETVDRIIDKFGGVA